jgi:hypothetical protein
MGKINILGIPEINLRWTRLIKQLVQNIYFLHFAGDGKETYKEHGQIQLSYCIYCG